MTSAEGISRESTVNSGDFKNAAEYGETDVKNAIKTYFHQTIDNQLLKEDKESGVWQLRKAVDKIDALPKQWRTIRSSAKNLLEVKNETINRLVEMLGSNPDSPLFEKINYYGHWSYNNSEKLAETFINAQSKHNEMELLNVAAGTKPFEEVLDGLIDEQSALLSQVKNDKFREAFNGYKQENRSVLRSPDMLAQAIEKQFAFYERLNSFFTSPKELLARIGHDFNGLDETSPREKELEKNSQEDRYLKFDDKTYSALISNPVSKIKAFLQQEQREKDKYANSLKEQMSGKIEADWARLEHNLFYEKKHSTVEEAETIIRKQRSMEELKTGLTSAIEKLQPHLAEDVSSIRGDISFNSIPQTEFEKLYDELDKTKRALAELERQITAVTDRAKHEGDGFMGGKKKKRQEEIADLTEKKSTAELTKTQLEQEYLPKKEMIDRLRSLKYWLNNTAQTEIKLSLPTGPISLRELITNIQNQLNFQLTPEQSQAYEKDQELRRKAEQARRRYVELKLPEDRRREGFK